MCLRGLLVCTFQNTIEVIDRMRIALAVVSLRAHRSSLMRKTCDGNLVNADRLPWSGS